MRVLAFSAFVVWGLIRVGGPGNHFCLMRVHTGIQGWRFSLRGLPKYWSL